MEGVETDPVEVLFDDEEDEDSRSFITLNYLLDVTGEEVEQARRKKGRHVYENFVRPLLDDGTYIVKDLMEGIGPCYNSEEVEAAFEYAERQDEIEYDDGEVR